MTPYLNKIIVGKDGIRRKLINITALSLEYEWCMIGKKNFDEVSAVLRLPETEAYFRDGTEAK
jgi:hypothetical protein